MSSLNIELLRRMIMGIPDDYSQQELVHGIDNGTNALSETQHTPESSQESINTNNNLHKNKRKRRRKKKLGQQISQQRNNEVNNNLNETVNILEDNSLYQPSLCNPVSNDIKGDTLDVKPEDNFRFIFQNINSFRPSTLDKWKATITKMLELGCDIAGFCETSINWQRKAIRNMFRSSLSHKSPIFGKLTNPHLSVSATKFDYGGTRLPGGTAMITSGRWTSQIESAVVDVFNMGRWSGNCYRLSGNKRLYIIAGYRPCQLALNTDNSLATAHQQDVITALD
jgi:hypothetical protein